MAAKIFVAGAFRLSKSPLRHSFGTLTKGGLFLGAAWLLRRVIEEGARHRLQQGHPQLAADGLHMLWVTIPLALVGALLLLRATLAIAAAVLQLWARPEDSSAQQPSAPTRCSAGNKQSTPIRNEAHLEACIQLGLPPGSSWSEIRKHWRRQVIYWHPDRGGDKELWHQRLAAYQFLLKQEERRVTALG